jgi:LuxR family transcriptional regulator, quorum-sensing system regulator CviR
VPHLHAVLTRVLSNPRHSATQPATKMLSLSTREKEVLKWMSCGKSNWEIAQVMGLSESTVKIHVHHILGKLQVGTRVQAVAKAISLKQINTKP